jgi:hypothetical protein
MNQMTMRGLCLVAIALCFGITAATYRIGTFSNAGPGLFPVLVSGILGVMGLVMIVRGRLESAAALDFRVRNLLIVLASLVGFVVIAEHLKVIPAIVFLVFVSTLAGADYSLLRNVKISVGLIAVAYAFHALLGLNLPLL